MRLAIALALAACTPAARVTPAVPTPTPASPSTTPAATKTPIELNPAEAVASVAAFCAAGGKDPALWICDRKDPGDVITSEFRAAQPYLGARLFWAGDSETIPGASTCYLAVQTAAGWFVANVAGDCHGVGKYKRSTVVDRLAVDDVIAGGAPELVVNFHVRSSDPIDREDGSSGREETVHSFIVVCSVDDGAARCTDGIQIAGSRDGDGDGDGDDGKARWALDVRFAGGLIEFRRDGKLEPLPEDAEALVGSHELR